MSRPASPIVCDGPGCGKQKQEANHWWTIGLTRGSLVNSPKYSETGEWPVLLVVAPIVEPGEFDQRYTLYDFCGTSCALKFISEQMGKVTS